MDPYREYKKQTEYDEYVENQICNAVDITDEPYQIAVLAQSIFTKSVHSLDNNLTGLLLDESMDQLDIHAMLIELILYGWNIINTKSIFESEYFSYDTVELIKKYLKSCNIEMTVDEIPVISDIKLYLNESDYYCEILPKSPSQFGKNEWCVLNYRMNINPKFIREANDNLDKYYSIIIINNDKIFSIKFNYARI